MKARTPSLLLACWIAVSAAHAQLADKPIRLIVPYPPGGSFDGPARQLATQLSKLADRPVLVENRVGAGGAIGAAEVAKAPADGHTLLVGSSALAVSSALSKQAPVDALGDFRHVGTFATVPVVIVSNPQRLKFPSWGEFIAASRTAPARYTFASAGMGSPSHLAAEMLMQAFAVEWLHVPYKGTGPALQDLLGGRVDFSVVGLSSALQHIRSGSLKALAVTETRRLAQLPHVPAIAETLPGFQYSFWLGLSVPAATPPATVALLESLLQKALADPDLHKRLLDAGVVPSYASSDATQARVRQELKEFADLGRRTGIALD